MQEPTLHVVEQLRLAVRVADVLIIAPGRWEATTLQLAREAGVDLMFTLKQLSYWSALHLGDAGIEQMRTRGRLQPGMIADIVVFDSKTVAPRSTYKAGENGLPPVGIPHVIVNGVPVKKDNEATGTLPGLPIRYPEEAEGRFVPVEVDEIK